MEFADEVGNEGRVSGWASGCPTGTHPSCRTWPRLCSNCPAMLHSRVGKAARKESPKRLHVMRKTRELRGQHAVCTLGGQGNQGELTDSEFRIWSSGAASEVQAYGLLGHSPECPPAPPGRRICALRFTHHARLNSAQETLAAKDRKHSRPLRAFSCRPLSAHQRCAAELMVVCAR